ncbi:coiled-coil domain-containing protein 86-like [Ostrea edulis]|uniref:coiled-coil domain-containing protein 86-like n=1 Tax=Ostrea edulis TaxID=37623 RepID=UPI0020947630|nr:coiled-coil domain-containing protein 86-like [Ostrea edulis]
MENDSTDRIKVAVETYHNIPRGRPKSGRPWKTLRNERFSAIRTTKTKKLNWDEKMKKRAEKKSIKKFEKELKEKRSKDLETKRIRQEEIKKRRLENERKSEVVQTIKDTAKIKRMKKKQLRKIEKR